MRGYQLGDGNPDAASAAGGGASRRCKQWESDTASALAKSWEIFPEHVFLFGRSNVLSRCCGNPLWASGAIPGHSVPWTGSPCIGGVRLELLGVIVQRRPKRCVHPNGSHSQPSAIVLPISLEGQRFDLRFSWPTQPCWSFRWVVHFLGSSDNGPSFPTLLVVGFWLPWVGCLPCGSGHCVIMGGYTNSFGLGKFVKSRLGPLWSRRCVRLSA